MSAAEANRRVGTQGRDACNVINLPPHFVVALPPSNNNNKANVWSRRLTSADSRSHHHPVFLCGLLPASQSSVDVATHVCWNRVHRGRLAQETRLRVEGEPGSGCNSVAERGGAKVSLGFRSEEWISSGDPERFSASPSCWRGRFSAVANLPIQDDGAS